MATNISERAIISDTGKVIVTRRAAGRLWPYFVSTTRALDAAPTAEAHTAICDRVLAYLGRSIATGRYFAAGQ